MFDSLVHYDKHILPTNTSLGMPTVPTALLYALPPLQVTSIFRKWWGSEMGVGKVQHEQESAADELEVTAQPPLLIEHTTEQHARIARYIV